MPARQSYDAVVVGAGPNGLAAAITLQRAGRSVLVLEAEDTIGGGTRSAELTLPGFIHDICSAIHPLGVGSPFFEGLPLAEHGLEWIYPPLAMAHPLDDGRVATLNRSIATTAASLGRDAAAYTRLMQPIVTNWPKLRRELLGPLRIPRSPFTMALFGLKAIQSAWGLARRVFKDEPARGFFGGMAAHAIQPLENSPTASFGLLLAALGHSVGWPLPRGGSQQIANALTSYLRSLGGEIVTATRVDTLADLPSARAVLFDLTPRQIVQIAGKRLPDRYRHKLEGYRYGPGVFKVDWALDGPIPWTASACARAGTVHLGGTLVEVAASERAIGNGQCPERPFVLLAQQSLFDSSRAPAGKHTAWGYCHVPNGSTVDMTARIEAQIERFAPGFGERIIARSVMG